MNRLRSYEEFIGNFTKSGKRVSDLSRIASLLRLLGNPQDKLKFVHIAGTNGKGSCAETLAKTLSAAGYKTGLFTSPYIFRYNDRIRINGEDISDGELFELAEEVKPHAEKLSDEGLSQFEITQAMAFLYFAKKKCDIVVLEAGVGGKLDSTNIIAPPLLSVICSVSFDHTAVLGKTIEEIAEQKSGIIKCGSPVILAPQNPAAVVKIVRRRAEECGSELIIPDINRLKVVFQSASGSRFEYDGDSYAVSMGGYHQIKNALTVIESVEILRKTGYNITRAALDEGLRAKIPGRLQIVSEKPLIIIDGGHNPEAVKALADALDGIDCKKCAVIGMLSDKDSDTAARYIVRSADEFICVDGFYPNARPKEELAGLLRSYGAASEASELSAEETIRRKIRSVPDGEALVICGSLFLASAANAVINEKRA